MSTSNYHNIPQQAQEASDRSRLIDLYKDDVLTRRRRVEEALNLPPSLLDALKVGLSIDEASQLVENVIGLYQLPLGIATNFVMDGIDRLIPMVVEEPSVIAAASNAARMARAGGGFTTLATEPITIAQVELRNVENPQKSISRLEAEKETIHNLCINLQPELVKRGGGFQSMEVRAFPNSTTLVVHLLVNCCDAMGANAVNTLAESVAPTLAEIAQADVGLRILSNLADHRLASARCRIPPDALQRGELSGIDVRDSIVAAHHFAVLDPYRAATHNKGIMNGIDAVIVATGNDWRAIEAGAHAYASRSGQYSPLSDWRVGEDGFLEGHLELPMSVGIVGGATRIHPIARLSCQILKLEKALDLARIAAAVGLAQNLAAIAALACEGIQRGHMALHNRSRGLEKP